ncbi:MAG: ABC transporter permease, partial [Terriglobales bacterium]
MRLLRAWRQWRARGRAWLRPGAAEAEMARELEAHVKLAEEDFIERGLDAAAARRAAELSFGSTEAAAERHREARSFAALERLARDTRQALRSLRRAPAFAAAAVLTLALGLGAAMAVFTAVNSVLLEPLPYPQAGRLVALRQLAPGAGGVANASGGLGLSLSMFLTYAQHNHSFSAMGVWEPDMDTVTGRGRSARVTAVDISDGVLQALAVPPLLGRWLGRADHDPQRTPTVMLSYGYWQRRFQGRASAVGKTLDVDGHARAIVGVMPPGFRIEDQQADLIVPLAFAHTGLKLAGFGFNGLARLRPGSTLHSADADLAHLLPVWMDSWTNCAKCDPHFYATWHITPALLPLKEAVVGGIAGVLWAVMATIGLLLLIAVGNVVNLFLVRGEARQHELAVRAALGAGRARLAQALLLESGLIALAGLAAGLALAQGAVVWLRTLGPAHLPRLAEIAIGPRVIVVGLVLAAATAMAAGLAPLWQRETDALAPVLASESRNASESRQRRRTRSALTVAQVAMALVLLLSAGLLLRSYAALTRVQPGFRQPEGVQTFRIDVPRAMVPVPASVVRTENTIVDRLQAIPGVVNAGFADQAPMQSFGGDWDIMVKKGEGIAAGSSPPSRWFTFISPGYLRTVGTRLLAGRDFTWADLYGLRHNVLLSSNLADEFFGSAAAALGQRVSPSGPGNWYQVIGVV